MNGGGTRVCAWEFGILSPSIGCTELHASLLKAKFRIAFVFGVTFHSATKKLTLPSKQS